MPSFVGDWKSAFIPGFVGLLLPSVVLALIVAGGTAGIYAQNAGLEASSNATGSSTRTVSGEVTNASTGLPVRRALVRLGGRAVLTDHDGKFEFDQYNGAGGTVQVIKPGYYFSTDPSEAGGRSVQAGQLTSPLQLRLYPEALLTGRLVSRDGDPLAHISISAVRRVFDDDEHWIPEAQTLTNTHGDFRLPVPAGDYRLETMYQRAGTSSSEFVLPVIVPDDTSSNTSDIIRIHSGEEQHFDLQPTISHLHNVMAAFEAGSGRGFSRIIARSADGTSFSVPEIRSGDRGTIRLELPNGIYTLTATMNNHDGMEQAETSVTVADHDISGVVFRFTPIPSLPVELAVDTPATSDNTEAPPNVLQLGLMLRNIQADSEQGMSAIHLLQTRDGGVAFAVPPGTYHLEARSSGAWYVKSATYGDSDLLQQDIVVAPGAGGLPIRMTVSNQTGSLQGSVSLNGQPAECWIYLVSVSPSAKPIITLRSNAEGGYTANNLAPGSYQAIAFESRYSGNYSDSATLAPYSTHVGSVTISPDDKATLDLDAVPATEIVP